MMWKNSLKHYFQRKKIQLPEHGRYYCCKLHATRGCKDFQTKSLGEYHDLYVQSDTLFLVDVLNSFNKMFPHIIGLDSVFLLQQDWYDKQS